MDYVIAFVAGGMVLALATWLWQIMTGQLHARVIRIMDEYLATSENQRLLEEFLGDGLSELGRSEIWRRMAWLWKETRGWVVRSGTALSWACLLFFVLLYIYVWFKTWVFPNSSDLRLLLGARSLLMYVAHDKDS